MKRLLFIVCLLASMAAAAQNVTIQGTVYSASDKYPMPGVSVMETGGGINGAVTDLDGKFQLSARVGATLEIRFIGYKPMTYDVKAAATGLEFYLQEDAEMLNEVIAIGYGTQKKSVVTAAISQIGENELAETAPIRVDNALKGLTSGVTVTSSSGQPGSASQVRVRGIGTINNSNPLYIVDGMPIEGGIDYLNPTDIKSIEVLKDAASGAVYGARAANGVILVTTKMGQSGRAKITYDANFGWQSHSKSLRMLNATEYAVLKNEGYLNIGQAAPYADPYSYGEGYDWQAALFNDGAPMQTHQLSVAGGSDTVNYYLSFGYMDQEGIIGGNWGQSNYDRLTLRSNVVATLFDDSATRSFLNKLTVTTNISYARINSQGIGGSSYYGGPVINALGMSPILTPTLFGDAAQQQLDYFASNPKYVPRYDKNGGLYTVPEAWGGGYQELTNPFYEFSFPAGQNWSHKFVANFIGELQIWDALKYRISYGADMGFWGSESHTEANYYSNLRNMTADQAAASSSWNRGYTWQLENVVTWDKTFSGHHVDVVLGQSAKESTGWYVGASADKLYNYDKPYVDVAQAQAGTEGDNRTGWAGPNNAWPRLLSYFGRVSYDYDNRYMVQATIRRDGSSRFGSRNKWATFPSFSIGWNPTNEGFLQDRPMWWTSSKVRFSWGKNGNESIGDFAYTVLTNGNNNYYFGPEGSGQTFGSKASGLANESLRWEESTQTDIGLDAAFFNNSLQFSVDYYNKLTTGMLMTMQVPTYVGESKPIGNVGSMSNQGVEMELHWKYNFGEWAVNAGGNLTYLKNRLIEYGNADGYANLDSNGTAGTISRAENGEVFPFFYGFKTGGIFQNQGEADAYNEKYGLAPGDTYFAQPGDVIYLDTNNDGTISVDDRTKLGKGLPDWTYGFNFGANWRGLALTAYFQGVWGNMIYDASLRGDTPSKNMPGWMLNRWTGEGTSNKIPIYRLGDSRNWQSSDIYLNDGAYLRLKNITLSYTLPGKFVRKAGLDNVRIYATAENLFTLTNYHGFDPEVGSGTGIGIEYGVYPQARTFSLGINISL